MFLKSEISLERYYKAFEESVSVFGRGEVSTYLLAGLGDSKESLMLTLNYLTDQNTIKLDKEKAKEIINIISKMHNIKKGILMKSLRVAFFGSLSGPDLIQSWELFAESKTDRTRIERCL